MKNSQNINDVCKEVLTILGYFNIDVIEKIPSEILNKLNELAADSMLDYYIDEEEDLINQDISEKAKDLISLLYYNYIVDENEKNEILKIWNDNDKTYQGELKKKYQSNNIFTEVLENKCANVETTKNDDNIALTDCKKSLFIKLKNFILRILNRNN